MLFYIGLFTISTSLALLFCVAGGPGRRKRGAKKDEGTGAAPATTDTTTSRGADVQTSSEAKSAPKAKRGRKTKGTTATSTTRDATPSTSATSPRSDAGQEHDAMPNTDAKADAEDAPPPPHPQESPPAARTRSRAAARLQQLPLTHRAQEGQEDENSRRSGSSEEDGKTEESPRRVSRAAQPIRPAKAAAKVKEQSQPRRVQGQRVEGEDASGSEQEDTAPRDESARHVVHGAQPVRPAKLPPQPRRVQGGQRVEGVDSRRSGSSEEDGQTEESARRQKTSVKAARKEKLRVLSEDSDKGNTEDASTRDDSSRHVPLRAKPSKDASDSAGESTVPSDSSSGSKEEPSFVLRKTPAKSTRRPSSQLNTIERAMRGVRETPEQRAKREETERREHDEEHLADPALSCGIEGCPVYERAQATARSDSVQHARLLALLPRSYMDLRKLIGRWTDQRVGIEYMDLKQVDLEDCEETVRGVVAIFPAKSAQFATLVAANARGLRDNAFYVYGTEEHGYTCALEFLTSAYASTACAVGIVLPEGVRDSNGAARVWPRFPKSVRGAYAGNCAVLVVYGLLPVIVKKQSILDGFFALVGASAAQMLDGACFVTFPSADKATAAAAVLHRWTFRGSVLFCRPVDVINVR